MVPLSKSPSLKDAEDSRLMARIERNFECLRRDGKAAGTLSGWGDLLLSKFRNTETEKSEMSPTQSSILGFWLKGSITGRVAMIEFLQEEQRVRQKVDPCSMTTCFGLGSILDSEWLFVNVFSRPPQAVIYETLLLCAEDALEKKPENLTASQINLALRKLALAYLPKSGESATDAAQSESETAVISEKDNLAAGIPTKARNNASANAEMSSAAAPGDHYLRIAVAMELLRLHILEGKQNNDVSNKGNKNKNKNNDKNNDKNNNVESQTLESLGKLCMEGLGIEDVEDIILKELEHFDNMSKKSQSENNNDSNVDDDSNSNLEDEVAEKLNRFLEAYVDSVNKVKQKLSHQVRWLDERGAYLLLGVDADATESSIKKRYHRLSLKAHPDKGGDAATFQNLTVAYETVMRKKKRAASKLAAMQKRGEEAQAAAAKAQFEARKAAKEAKAEHKKRTKEAAQKKNKKNSFKKNDEDIQSTPSKNTSTTTKSSPRSAKRPNREVNEKKAESTKRAQMAKYGQRRPNPFSSPTPSSHEKGSDQKTTIDETDMKKEEFENDNNDDDGSLPSPHSPDDWRVFPPTPPHDEGEPHRSRGAQSPDDWDLRLSDDDDDESDGTEVINSDSEIIDEDDHYHHEDGSLNDSLTEDDKKFEEYMKSRVRGSKNNLEESASFELDDDNLEPGLNDEDFLAADDDRDDEDGVDKGGTSFEGDLFQSFENDDDDDDEGDDGIWPGEKPIGIDLDAAAADDDKPVFSCEFGAEFGPSFGTETKKNFTEVEVEDVNDSDSDDDYHNGAGGGGDVDSDDDDDDENKEDDSLKPKIFLTSAEHLKKLSELEHIAKSAAKKAASLAHICIQWSKVVEEVRQLSRPRGVDHLSSLIKKGAFSSAVDVMEPTQEAASSVMDIVGSAIEVTKENPLTMGLASNMGFFKSADRVTSEGRAALSSAATASEVNAAAVKAMSKLGSLGDLARQDDEVHAALVDMLCLHFQRVADSTQQCAKQALVAVTAASHVCSLVDLIHSQAKLEAESNEDDDLSDDEDSEKTRDDQEEVKKAQEAAREAANKKNDKKGDNENEEDDENDENGKENQSPENKNKKNSKGKNGEDDDDDDDEETVDSLLGKLRELHAQMRLRHAANLKKANAEVLCLQTRIEKSLSDYSLNNDSMNKDNSSSSSSSKSINQAYRPLLLTLADLVNSSCLSVEESYRNARKSNVEILDKMWWKNILNKYIGWMFTLTTRSEIAIAASSRGKIIRLAASKEPQAVIKILNEMAIRLKLFASTDTISKFIDEEVYTMTKDLQ